MPITKWKKETILPNNKSITDFKNNFVSNESDEGFSGENSYIFSIGDI